VGRRAVPAPSGPAALLTGEARHLSPPLDRRGRRESGLHRDMGDPCSRSGRRHAGTATGAPRRRSPLRLSYGL